MKKTKCKVTKAEAGSEDLARDQQRRAHLAPERHTAISYKRYTTPNSEQPSLRDLVGALEMEAHAINEGDLRRPEAMLATQAYTLDAIFNNLARRSIDADDIGAKSAFMKLALKAQSQCRSSVEALADIKAPKAVAFVRQANIANGHQQINNGGRSEPHAHGNKLRKAPNELLEHENGEWMDGRATSETSRVNPNLEPVELRHGTKDGTGESDSEQERGQGTDASQAT